MIESFRLGGISRVFRTSCLLVTLIACASPAHARLRKRIYFHSMQRVTAHLHHVHRVAMWIPDSPSAAPRFAGRSRSPARLSVLPVADLPREQVFATVEAHAQAIGVPAELAVAVTKYESGGDCRKVGGVGERGPMQVRPETAAAMGLHPRDCSDWIDAGLKYLKIALEKQGRYGLDVAVSAYNHGVGFAKPTSYGTAVLRAMAPNRVPL